MLETFAHLAEMQQFIRSAALAATLLLAPATVPAAGPATPSVQAFQAAASGADVDHGHESGAARGPAAGPVADEFGLAAQPATSAGAGAIVDLAPGQSAADFRAWLDRVPAHRAEAEAFRAELAAEGLDRVVPVWQLLRTSSSWRQCAAQPFEVAPRDKWAHIAATLRFVRDEVVPALGQVEALSGYRDESLNACSDGAPQSAHRLFFAIDLTPRDSQVSRAAMIRDICAAHARFGPAYATGLGFYSGRRFHVDSNGFRKWGADGRGATSPCLTGRYS
jgi:Peptidase M15